MCNQHFNKMVVKINLCYNIKHVCNYSQIVNSLKQPFVRYTCYNRRKSNSICLRLRDQKPKQ